MQLLFASKDGEGETVPRKVQEVAEVAQLGCSKVRTGTQVSVSNACVFTVMS